MTRSLPSKECTCRVTQVIAYKSGRGARVTHSNKIISVWHDTPWPPWQLLLRTCALTPCVKPCSSPCGLDLRSRFLKRTGGRVTLPALKQKTLRVARYSGPCFDLKQYPCVVKAEKSHRAPRTSINSAHRLLSTFPLAHGNPFSTPH